MRENSKRPYIAMPTDKRWYQFWKKSYNCYYSNESNGIARWPKESFINYLLGSGYYDLAAYVIEQYYCVCFPLADAIDRITREIAAVPPKVWDLDKEKYVEHPVLELLNKPNADSTYGEYITKLAAFFLLTGENYNISTGNITRPPLEIYASNPRYITITPASDGFAGNIQLNRAYGHESYKRHDVEGRFKYYNKALDQEIYQAKTFNPKERGHIHGESPLQAVYYELEQYLKSSVHNLSLLLRGATVTGFLKTDQDLSFLTDDQKERLREQWNNCFSGSENAGRTGIFDKGISYQAIGQTNVDMNFRDLKNDVKDNIYIRLGIPLALVSSETMTMNNLSTAKVIFYDNAVIPLLKRLFQELTLFLMYRYPDSEHKMITFDKGDILALESRRNEQLAVLQKTGVLTINELRALIDYEPLDGGDVLLAPSTEVPIATDVETGNPDATGNVREKFVDLMRNQTNSDGVRKYTDEEIEAIANRHLL